MIVTSFIKLNGRCIINGGLISGRICGLF